MTQKINMWNNRSSGCFKQLWLHNEMLRKNKAYSGQIYITQWLHFGPDSRWWRLQRKSIHIQVHHTWELYHTPPAHVAQVIDQLLWWILINSCCITYTSYLQGNEFPFLSLNFHPNKWGYKNSPWISEIALTCRCSITKFRGFNSIHVANYV